MKFRQKITLSLFLTIVLGSVAFAQVVDIPDPNLREVISEHLNLPPNAQFDQSDMAALVELNAVDRHITRIAGLEHATNLTRLYVARNNISDIMPIAGLTKLERLSMSSNPLSDLGAIANLTRLTRLDLENCQIKDITPLQNLSNLVELQLNRNQIHDLRPLAGLSQLTTLHLHQNDISDISPLAQLTQLNTLTLPVNPLSDLGAIANLTRLTFLDLGYCQIIDISPLRNLTELVELQLNANQIYDLRPLAELSQLTTLHLHRNNIVDISPLANLTHLNMLTVHTNNITDHSAISGLSIPQFLYDQPCDTPPIPIRPRLENRTFPSVFAAWSHILNQPHLSTIDRFTKHDLYWTEMFGLRFVANDNETVVAGHFDVAIQHRDAVAIHNPNMIFLVEIRMRDASSHHFPEDSPYWARDDQGNTFGDPWRVIDFTHPHVQDMIVQQAVAVSKCGLYDGIFLDWWNEFDSVVQGNNEAEQAARDSILERIRTEVRPDFLIMVNTNTRIIPRTGMHINGGFMETGVPHDETGKALEEGLSRVEHSLFWLEHNLRPPRINGFEGWGIPTQPPDSPDNLRWMRVSTTLSLTHSDGYVVYTNGTSHNHYWYDFWDADLGRPIGEKGQLYQEIEGLYIREFTNGWAVYNHSGEAQVITLPEEVQGVASGLANMEHVLTNLDGEMYLRVKPKNPADVNGDGVVNIFDLTLVAQGFGTDSLEADVNGDGVVNVFDLVFVANQF